jgi:hypothetical protein
MKMKEQEVELMKLKIETDDRFDTQATAGLRPRLPYLEYPKMAQMLI